MSSTKQIALLCCFFATKLLSMDDPHVRKATSIPDDKIITLVVLGGSGAGKSTWLNGGYNWAKMVRWNEAKFFPIPTPFQKCNVEQYKERVVEDHERGQLGAVTQEPSEYVAQGRGFIVKMIDCPGTADPRGIEVDIKHTQKIATFLSNVGHFNALCIVMKGSANRETAEQKYLIEQLKTIIPASAYNRIFIVATYTNLANDNVVSFAKSVGLPTDNIFYFDNFALTKEAQIDFSKVDLSVPSEDEDFQDPFGTSGSNNGDKEKRELAKKVKQTWIKGYSEFSKLLNQAQKLGTHSTVDLERISRIKKTATDKIFAAFRKVEAIEECETDLRAARSKFQRAVEEFNNAQQNKETTQNELDLARAERTAADALSRFEEYTQREEEDTKEHHTTCSHCAYTCHLNCELSENEGFDHLIRCSCVTDGYCTVCPKKCHYTWHRHEKFIWKTVTKQRERNVVRFRQADAFDNFQRLQSKLSVKDSDLNEKATAKKNQSAVLEQFETQLDSLNKEKEDLQQQIVMSYIELGFVTISSVNFHIGEYYDIKIRNETDSEQRNKLNRDRTFYIEQTALYQKCIELIPIFANNISLIFQDNLALRNPFPITPDKITAEEYATWADLIIAKEKERLMLYKGENANIKKALAAKDLKLKAFTIFALKTIFEG